MEAIRVVVTAIAELLQPVLMEVMCPFWPSSFKAVKECKWIHLNVNGRQFNTCMHQVYLACNMYLSYFHACRLSL